MADQYHKMSSVPTETEVKKAGGKRALSNAEKHIKNVQINQIQPPGLQVQKQSSYRKPKVLPAFPAGADFFESARQATTSLDVAPTTQMLGMNHRAASQRNLYEADKSIWKAPGKGTSRS